MGISHLYKLVLTHLVPHFVPGLFTHHIRHSLFSSFESSLSPLLTLGTKCTLSSLSPLHQNSCLQPPAKTPTPSFPTRPARFPPRPIPTTSPIIRTYSRLFVRSLRRKNRKHYHRLLTQCPTLLVHISLPPFVPNPPRLPLSVRYSRFWNSIKEESLAHYGDDSLYNVLFFGFQQHFQFLSSSP